MLRQYNRLIFTSLAILGLVAVAACGDDAPGDGGTNDGSPVPTDDAGNPLDDAGNPITDGGPGTPDAAPPAGCDPDGPQCNNCIDDDNDGYTDGFDVHCISSIDDDESSFATGISGDNMDMTWQDCFFDGNSGAGDDGCRYNYCCLLGEANCPNGGFDPVADCEITQECIDNCGALAPPGCDCFGCCTICNNNNDCVDVVTNPAVAPDCTVDANNNPVNCPACIPSADCGSPCTPMGCTLCPGQTEEDLPPECTGAQCPNNETPCNTSNDCTATQFCSVGCCINQIG